MFGRYIVGVPRYASVQDYVENGLKKDHWVREMFENWTEDLLPKDDDTEDTDKKKKGKGKEKEKEKKSPEPTKFWFDTNEGNPYDPYPKAIRDAAR